MVTFDELKNANFGGLDESTAVWSGVMQKLDQAARSFQTRVCDQTEVAGWHGKAKGTADDELEKVWRRLSITSLEARAITAELNIVVPEFRTLQNRLLSEVHAAEAEGFVVTPNGVGFTVSEPPGVSEDVTDAEWVRSRQAKVNGYVDRIAAILGQATDADSRCAADLAKIRPAEVRAADSAALQNSQADVIAGIPPMNPVQAKAWWDSLNEQQKQWFTTNYAYQVGTLDGLPATVRDQANRLALDARLTELNTQVQLGTASEAEKRELTNLTKIKTKLDHNAADLANAMTAPPGSPTTYPLMLLRFGNESLDGRVIMAVGNPDTAKHTAVYVPGVNTTIASGGTELDGALSRVTTLQRASDSLTPENRGDVASILFLDYDAPEVGVSVNNPLEVLQDSVTKMAQGQSPFTAIPSSMVDVAVGSAVGWDRSAVGGQRLDSFINGLDAQQPGQHITAVGHSYGSTVIGDGAREGNGLAVDDIVVAGSPGMHVPHASALNIQPNHVWAEQSPNYDDGVDGEWVPGIGAAGHAGSSRTDAAARGAIELGGIEAPVPADPSFGGNRLTVDSQGHSGYWDEGSISLDNQAKVIMQTYNDPNPERRPVLEHGTLPTS